MAKLTREICDFCGGELGHPRGILQVPQYGEHVVDALLAMVTRRLGYREYDICKACCDGLVNSRSETVKLTIGFEKA